MIRYFVLSAMLVCSAASIAVEKPPVKEVLTSRRIEYVDFQDERVYPLLGVTNHPLVIEFPDGQTILEVAGGGIGGWDVQRKGSRLFVRALPEAKLSTMLVLTDAHSYVFDLVPASPSPENLRMRRSRFVFNAPAKVDKTMALADDAKPLAVEKPAEKLVENTPSVSPALEDSKAPEALKAEVPVEKPAERLVENTPSVSPELEDSKAPEALKAEAHVMKPALNRNYTMQIVKEEVIIRPKEVFDDGVFTWFLFPKSQSVPVLYKSVPGTREEAVINFHMEGDYVVAHATSALWNLRLGGSLVGVYNESFDPTGLSGKSR